MRFSRSMVVATAVILLAACQGHESVTGAYGSQMLSGVVTMAAGMANSSPAGVRVSVSGTGMSTVLGADGQFSFFNVPETAQMIFSRDDVNATLRIASSPAPLAIELSSNSAHVGRHRVTPQGPQLQTEGTIVTVSDTQLVVQPEGHGSQVTFVMTPTTAIYQGDTLLKASDLKTGDQVHVKATVSGTTNTAMIVFLQNEGNDTNPPNNGGQTMTANGTVTAVAAGQITVMSESKGSVVVKYDSSTVVRMEGSVIQGSDIKVGWEVNCLGKRIDDHTLQATQIEVRGVSDHP